MECSVLRLVSEKEEAVVLNSGKQAWAPLMEKGHQEGVPYCTLSPVAKRMSTGVS